MTLEKIFNAGLYLLLLTPLIYLPQLAWAGTVAKTVYFQVLVAVLAAIYIFLAIFSEAYRPKLTAISGALLVLLLILFVASFLGVDWPRSFWSTVDRQSGLFLWLHLAAFFLMLKSANLNWQKFFTAAVLVSALAAIAAVFLPTLDRFSGTLGNPLFVAYYLVPNVFLALWLAFAFTAKGSRRWLFLAIAGGEILLILIIGSRGAALGLIAGFLVLAFLKHRSHYFLPLLAGLIIAGLFFGFNLERLAPEKIFRDAQPRLINWQIILEAFLEKPFLGWGWENYFHAFNQHYQPQLLQYGETETRFDRPHNLLLEFLVTSGLAGLLLYLILLFFVWRRALLVSPYLAALVSAYFIQNLLAFDTINNYLTFFALMAFL